MKTLIDFDNAVVVAIPVRAGFGEPGRRECMLLEGPQGWGEFSPPPDIDDHLAARWLTAAVEPGTVGWPDAVRGRVPVAVEVPALDPEQAHQLVAAAGCRTAEVRVTGVGDTARVAAVRDALGPRGRLRCVADGTWDVETAAAAVAALARAAGDLEYVEQPCRTAEELATLRRNVDVRIAVRAVPGMSVGEVADVVVLECASLGGVRRSLRIAETTGLPAVVRAGRQTSIGIAGAVALAGALPELPFDCAVGRPSWVSADVASTSRALVAADGYVPVAPMPPAPESALLQEYAIDDADRLTWWRGRLARARGAL
ncbi:enolase C-terminal domain-like protein [Mycolicibacterium mengxianglii]|uniref:enolase C-terminal domain-like protein n=1 Tax=Mycolicibacterium mengxianglii TaxID=2736649 RepID=UPI0018EF1B6E|nr:enolase C-terminal domain-like protein [Mycolicibacterium mengxianglii]